MLIDLDVNDELDITSAERLEELVDALRQQGLWVGLVHPHQPAVDMASRTGLLEKVGKDHIFSTLASGGRMGPLGHGGARRYRGGGLICFAASLPPLTTASRPIGTELPTAAV